MKNCLKYISLLILLVSVNIVWGEEFRGKYDVLASGIGLNNASEGIIDLDINGNVILKNIYWSSNRYYVQNYDYDLIINNQSVQGVELEGDKVDFVLKADITNINNPYSISGFDIPIRFGAGILAVYEDNSLENNIVIIKDVNSHFWWAKTPLSDIVTFDFQASIQERNAKLILLVSGAQSHMTDIIWYKTRSENFSLLAEDELIGNNGNYWDTYIKQISIHENSTFLSIQIESPHNEDPHHHCGDSSTLVSAALVLPLGCVDSDNDGYGQNCVLGSDCDDSNPNINPGSHEICGNNVDDNCDGIDLVCPSLDIDAAKNTIEEDEIVRVDIEIKNVKDLKKYELTIEVSDELKVREIKESNFIDSNLNPKAEDGIIEIEEELSNHVSGSGKLWRLMVEAREIGEGKIKIENAKFIDKDNNEFIISAEAEINIVKREVPESTGHEGLSNQITLPTGLIPASWSDVDIQEVSASKESVNVNQKILENIKAGATSEKTKKSIEEIKHQLLEDKPITKQLTVYNIKNKKTGEEKFASKISYTIKGTGKTIKVIELIPKDIAISASEIIFEDQAIILQDDPIIEWIITNLKAGSTKELSYYVNKKIEKLDTYTVAASEKPAEKSVVEVVSSKVPLKPVKIEESKDNIYILTLSLINLVLILIILWIYKK